MISPSHPEDVDEEIEEDDPAKLPPAPTVNGA